MDIKLLEEIGLTKSEVKVYLALIKLGSASKSSLVRESDISSSKIYEVTDKLIEKGLVSYFLRNKVKNFKPAPPSKLKDYLKEKRIQILKQEEQLSDLVSKLSKGLSVITSTPNAEIFEGWKGMETVFQDMINSLKKGETDYVFGASKGANPGKTRKFYDRYMDKAHAKGIKIKVIMNEESRQYYKSSKALKKHVQMKYLDQTTPTEINIYKDKVLLIILKENPVAVIIKGEYVSHSFKQYFDTMWKIAKK